jgi:GH24 family phage-related lysozyme (muramidase)
MSAPDPTIRRIQTDMLTVPGVTLPRYGADGQAGAEFWDAWAQTLALAKLGAASLSVPVQTQPYALTERVCLELLHHEAIVQEAYRDSVGVWTWGVGVTSASGHSVERYKDNPQTIERVLEVFVWLLRTRYAPAVRDAFHARALSEAQFAAALSFHWNTGAIGRASWVREFLDGSPSATVRASFLEWRNPPEIRPRRAAECELFLSERWVGDGMTTVYPVRKPSYTPDWGKARRVDVRDELRGALGT